MGVIQHEQISGSADGEKYGLRTWEAEHQSQLPFAWAHLYFVSSNFFPARRNGADDPTKRRMTAAYLDKEPQLLEKWSNLNPMGRIGRPDEMRGVAVWLASDASSFCTGSE